MPHLLLALETSSERCSAAIVQVALDSSTVPDTATAVAYAPEGNRHAEQLLLLVEQLLVEHQLRRADIGAVAAGVGPGAFTGVRIACGLAQGLALGLPALAFPVTAFAALAERARRLKGSVTHVLTAIDARMGEVYWAPMVWQAERADWQLVGTPQLSKPVHLQAPSDWVTEGADLVCIGSGFMLPGAAAASQALTLIDTLPPDAQDIAALAARRWVRSVRLTEGAAGADTTHSPVDLQPLYVRDNVAQTIGERAAAKAALSLSHAGATTAATAAEGHS